MRNPDPNTKRYTSLAWAAIYGHKETFEYLLNQGHDDDELSKVRYVFSNITHFGVTDYPRILRIIPFSYYLPTHNLPP